jgi:hypothetical protein
LNRYLPPFPHAPRGHRLDFSLPHHRDRLVEMVADIAPQLLIIDSLSSISSKGENSIEDVRTVLGFLPAGVALKWDAVPTPYHEPSKADECRTWLADQLIDAGDAGLRPAEIVERGADQGFSRAMIYRARDELGASITNTHGRKHPENAWKWTAPGT